jgi:urea transporter
VVIMLALSNLLKTWGVSALTAPFVLTAWLLLLATNAFSGLEGAALLLPAGMMYSTPAEIAQLMPSGAETTEPRPEPAPKTHKSGELSGSPTTNPV